MVEKIVFTKEAIKAGETLALVDIYTGKVQSDKIRFLPWGKRKLAKKALPLQIIT